MTPRLRSGAVRLGLAVVLVSVTVSDLGAWNARVHRAIARVAAGRLTPQVAERIRMLLASESDPSLEAASVWADSIRHHPEFRFSSLGHFIEIPLSSDATDPSGRCPNGDCITESLTVVGKALADESMSNEKRAVALKFLIHLIADIHQPLHCASNDDAGGNRVAVALEGRRTNLHAFWDGGFLGDTTEDQIVQRLDTLLTDQRVAAWSQPGDPDSWARECFAVAKRVAYQDPFPNRAGLVPLSVRYRQATEAVAFEQAAKAAVRTASELNRVLSRGASNISSWFYPDGRANRVVPSASNSSADSNRSVPINSQNNGSWGAGQTVYWIGGGVVTLVIVTAVAWAALGSRRRDVFVSYRRKASAGHAGRICDRLGEEFGRDHMLRDVESIHGGADFAEAIKQQLATCDVVIAVIGPEWAQDRRLHDPDDLLRRELSMALAANVPIIPILVQDAVLPEIDELPDDLKPLRRRQAIRVSDELFEASMESVIRAIRKSPRRLATAARPKNSEGAPPPTG